VTLVARVRGGTGPPRDAAAIVVGAAPAEAA
jgi:hypothetical protein